MCRGIYDHDHVLYVAMFMATYYEDIYIHIYIFIYKLSSSGIHNS